ncbi:phage-like protein [Yersinia aldovae]|uniref:hypothetical protein n=1 Tax=Yersinia aldovae TaxID=29483 RepID=UPI0005DA7BB1|nr:hypothetical protein [Yersinia aldovae]CNJ14637.1 phage-like protein [Yersinia aldovae]
MNNLEELREHCEEMMAISPLRYAYIPASSIITLIDRIEKAEAELSAANERIDELELNQVEQNDANSVLSAALDAANERLIVPAGYCIMPESLTAENGAKGALSGEFFTETDITCEECGGDCDEDDPCKHCSDLGVQTVRAAIGWSTIKDIYKMAVGATAIRQAGFTVKEDATPIVIVPAPAGVIMRPQFDKPLERCAAGRDGECHHKDCPQLRDNEPMATGRHCPIDNWDDE